MKEKKQNEQKKKIRRPTKRRKPRSMTSKVQRPALTGIVVAPNKTMVAEILSEEHRLEEKGKKVSIIKITEVKQ